MVVVDGVEMLDVREAADLAQRSPETIRRWVWSGRLRATKIGGRLLMDRRDVHAELASDEPAEPDRLTLSAWSDLVRAHALKSTAAGGRSASAADLVLGDRRRRSGR